MVLGGALGGLTGAGMLLGDALEVLICWGRTGGGGIL